MSDGRYRVLPGPDEETVRLLDREEFDPVVIAREGHPTPVTDLRPGYLVATTLDWSDPDPTVTTLEVVRPTRYAFVDGVDPVFEVARTLWRDARMAGEGMNSSVTTDTDGRANGVVYVFAEGDVRSRFAEFRDGTRPLEPLVDRVNNRDDGPKPREVFVLRPAADPYVVVTITLDRDGQFAGTMRETYDCPVPDEPLVD